MLAVFIFYNINNSDSYLTVLVIKPLRLGVSVEKFKRGLGVELRKF